MNTNSNTGDISESSLKIEDGNRQEAIDVNTFSEQLIEENNIRISFVPSKRKKTKKINIVIEGNFNLTTTGLACEKIIPVFEHFDCIDFSLRNISQIDLAAVQLLYFLKNKYTETNKIITIEADLSIEDRTVLFNSGLMGLLTKQKVTDNN